MSKKQKKKSNERLMKLALITALISLTEKIIELIIKLLETLGVNNSPLLILIIYEKNY